MFSNKIKFAFAYNQWANWQVLDTAAHLTQDEFLAGQGSSTANPSIRDTLVHTMSAQEVWLARWNGVSPTRHLDPHDFGTVALIREYWEQVEAHTQGYLQVVQDDVLEAPFTYNNLSGKPFTQPLWETMLHAVNHSTQHRSEVAFLLTQRNHSPGELDMVWYMRLRDGTAK